MVLTKLQLKSLMVNSRPLTQSDWDLLLTIQCFTMKSEMTQELLANWPKRLLMMPSPILIRLKKTNTKMPQPSCNSLEII